MKITTSELITKMALASEESCKCEDENYFRMVTEKFDSKTNNEPATMRDVLQVARLISDFSRFSSIRATCKVLQELELIENDVDVLDNDAFRESLSKAFK